MVKECMIYRIIMITSWGEGVYTARVLEVEGADVCGNACSFGRSFSVPLKKPVARVAGRVSVRGVAVKVQHEDVP